MWDIVRRTRRCTGDRLLSLAWWCRELVLHLMLVKVWASVQLMISPVSSHESCFLLHHPLSALHILAQVVSTESLLAEFQPVHLPRFWSESCVCAWQRWVQTQAWVGRAIDYKNDIFPTLILTRGCQSPSSLSKECVSAVFTKKVSILGSSLQKNG